MSAFLEQLATRNLEGEPAPLRPRLLSRYEEATAADRAGNWEETQGEEYTEPATSNFPSATQNEPTSPPLTGAAVSLEQPAVVRPQATPFDPPIVNSARPAATPPIPLAMDQRSVPEAALPPQDWTALARRLDQLDARLVHLSQTGDSRPAVPRMPEGIVSESKAKPEIVLERHYHEVEAQRIEGGQPSAVVAQRRKPTVRPANPFDTSQPKQVAGRGPDAIAESLPLRVPRQPFDVSFPNESRQTPEAPPAPQVIVERMPPARESHTVTVTIGRIEVRPPQSPASAVPTRPQQPTPRIMSLDDYVRRRQGGVG